MGLKTFWNNNWKGYLYSCLAVALLGAFIGMVKKFDASATTLSILVSFPLIFLMSFGIYSLSGGDHE